MQETLVQSLGWEIPWRRDKLPTPVFLGFPRGSDGKESARNAGDLGSIPGLGRSPGEGNGNPLHYSCHENSMNRGAWQAPVHGMLAGNSLLSPALPSIMQQPEASYQKPGPIQSLLC